MFSCPVCHLPLCEEENRLICGKNHSYDRARSGYVNLLPPSGKRQHGDNRLMLSARREFLDGGYYRPLLDALCAEIDRYTADHPTLLDAGCGECYYTEGVNAALSARGKAPATYGVDVSKDALSLGGRRKCGAHLAAASLYKLPFADGGFDLIYNVFAPLCAEEFARVLKQNGILLLAVPLARHLWELKKLLYSEPYENKLADTALPSFDFLGRTDVVFKMHLEDAAALDSLFKMTPYYYRTPQSARERIAALDRLDVSAEFAILAYRRA